ncbi:MAG TPA: hypothetical protein VLF66_06670 [Thermoanaerobaculia bacterium]|nr:hypothetical protein [Thermoanaerobaculia bacterium]
MDPQGEEMIPLYPDLQISLRTDHPLALVSATRLALRRAGKDAGEIERFTRVALASKDPKDLCSRWVRITPEPRRA